MESIYLRQVDFHTPETDDEIFEIRKKQNIYMLKNWLKRLLLSLILITIFVVFQIAARHTVPHMFGEADTVEKLVRNSIYVFLGFNVLSYIELYYEMHVLFDIKKAKVAKLTVKKKMVIDVMSLVPFKIRHLMCEKDGAFVIDRVYVRGYFPFTNIKEGQEIYVERRHDEGHYQYYYLA